MKLTDTLLGNLKKAMKPLGGSSLQYAGHALVKSAEPELQIVWGEVYAPGFPDSQGDFMDEETIMQMAYDFMEKQHLHKIDLQHTQEPCGAFVVESFIARKGDDIFIPGSWVIGVKVPDPEIWGLVKSGELNGFSLDGFGVRVEEVLEIEMPHLVKGETDEVDGHTHGFEVSFGDNGEFLGGQTTPGPDGHIHKIASGTVTGEANGHTHRFSFVEGVLANANG